MQFTQIHHCSMAVQDLERAAAFYRDVLGLTEIVIPATFPAAGLKVRWFRLGAQQIHLVLEAGTQLPSQRHMALQAGDAGAERLRLKAQGLEVQEAVPIPGADRFFIADPDGNQIEIIEWKEAYAEIVVPHSNDRG